MGNKSKRSSIADTETFLSNHLNKGLLRLITCGSVDDGKSTLLGRILYDTQVVFSDQLSQLKLDNKRFGTQDGEIDFALLVDGLSAEREQGITIDVAYRYFFTEKRKFIVADTPGHEQYTRNMVTGASTAEAAIILIDARKGLLTQTKRHSYICQLLGINHIIVTVNKMDLVQYDETRFNKIINEFEEFSKIIELRNISFVPISGIKGDNIVSLSKKMPWYEGPSLIKLLENLELETDRTHSQPFRLPVQWVNRPNSDFRGVSGKVVSGYISKNDEICILPSGKKTKVERIITPNGDAEICGADQSITITFSDEIDCSRGQVLSAAKAPLEVADQFETTIIWMSDDPLIPGRSYYLKIGALEVSATLGQPKYKLNVATNEQTAAKTLKLNEIGCATLTTDQNIPFTTYQENRDLGGFILVDKFSNLTIAAGLINFSLRRSQNIHWQNTIITRHQRAEVKGQKPMVLWMTGLSGSGKSTIANAVEFELANNGYHTYLLDGDNIRHGLNKDLGFTDADRIENIRRIGEVSKLMADAGLVVITAFISPFQSERNMVRQMMKRDEFVEIFVDTPIEVAEKRDTKGLYAKARSGKLKNFTGIDSPYEKPHSPEIRIDTTKTDIDEAASLIVKYYLKSTGAQS